MSISPEFTPPIGGQKPQPQKGGSQGPSDKKVSKAAEEAGVVSSPTGQEGGAIPADISRLQPASSIETQRLRETAVAGVEGWSEKATEQSVQALVERFDEGHTSDSCLLQTFLHIPPQALQNLKKVNSQLHSEMVDAVLEMIRTGDKAEILAVFDNDEKLVRTLTELGPNINESQDEDESTPLCEAASHYTERSTGDKLIKILVALGADVNKEGIDGKTPFYEAVQAGRTETVKLLASLGADANRPNESGETPMRYALLNAKCDMIQTLLSLHATYTREDLNEPGILGTPLYHAVTWQDEEKVRLLVSLGADINKPGSKEGETPLCTALFGGSASMIKLLISLGAQVRFEDVNARNTSGETPLTLTLKRRSSLQDRLDKVKLLTSLGTDCNIPDKEGYSPLDLVEGLPSSQQELIPQCLIEHGADPGRVRLKPAVGAEEKAIEQSVKALVEGFERQDSYPSLLQTFLHIPPQALQNLKKFNKMLHTRLVGAVLTMIRTGDQAEILAIFDNNKEIVKELSKQGNFELSLLEAARSSSDMLLKILAALGEDLNKKDLWGKTPLLVAVQAGRIETVKLLASLGADVNIPDDKGETPMRYALLSQKYDMIQTLLSFHAAYTPEDVNESLARAVQRDDEEMVRLLVSSLGADINRPPLRTALFNGKLSMIKLLIGLGAQVRSEDVNARTQSGNTPLNAAIHNVSLSQIDRVNLVRFITSLGADCNIPDNEGYTPLECANGLSSFEEALISQCLIDHGADKDWYENVKALRGLAHSWTLEGEGKCYNEKTHTVQHISLRGRPPLSSLKLARQLFRDFVEEKMKPMGPYYQELGEKILTTLNVSLDCQTSLEPTKEIIRLSEKGPVVLMGGTSTHAIGYILYKNRICVCNRGMKVGKESSGIKEYEFNRKLPSQLQFFIQGAFSRQESLEELDAKFRALLPILIGEIVQSGQKAGNCTWANLESALLALLLIRTEIPPPPEGKQLEVCKHIYKLFTKYAREKTLLAYLQTPKVDPSVLQQIVNKLNQQDSPFSTKEKMEFARKIEDSLSK